MLHARALERQYLFFSPGNIQHSEFYSKKIDRFKFYNICKPGHRKGRVKFSAKLVVTMVLKQDQVLLHTAAGWKSRLRMTNSDYTNRNPGSQLQVERTQNKTLPMLKFYINFQKEQKTYNYFAWWQTLELNL